MESQERNEIQQKSEIKEDFKLKVEINKWEQKTNKATGKLEVIFNIELFSEITKKKWSVYHSIQDFKDLILNLSSICINMQEYPGFKSIEKEKSSSSMINKASSVILEFINSTSFRSDIINSQYYIDFLNLENHFDDMKKNEPREKFHISNLKHEVSDIILLEKLDILIVGCAYDLNQNLLSKMNFWNRKEKKGQLNIYKINNNQENGHVLFSQIDTDSQISCLCVSEETKNILVGYFNGNIEVYDLPEFSETQGNDSKLFAKNVIEVSPKKNRVINIGYDSSSNYFYSACYKDIMITVGKIENKVLDFSIPGSENDLCGFYYKDKYNNLLSNLVIEMDIKGKIYIGTINKETKSLSLLFVLTDQINPITLFKASFEYNHIYIGDKEGNLDILSFEISLNNENQIKTKVTKVFNNSLSKNNHKFANMITRNYPYKINDIWYNPKRKEILIALENRTVQIFSHFKNFAECVIYEKEKTKESKGINKIYFSKLNSILYTGRAEKDIYVYQMPENYNSEITRRLEETNSYEILNGSKICKNAIEKGHPNTTQFYKKKTIIEKLGKNK